MLFPSCTPNKIDFNTEIRPIINEHCASCHGGVKQSGGFGLVFRENAVKETENGRLGIVPGHPDQSEMYHRITHHDPDERMPEGEDPLAKEQISLIKKWIAQGAKWEDHWAYLPLQQTSPPNISSPWLRTDIDRFVLQKMNLHGLSPSPEADRETLVRRIYLDLVGLPPNPEQVRKFVEDKSENAYETLVDELLASPHYGEHLASFWLDLARYADSFGYSSDVDRVIWQYRDWVIRALNDDMPFDQFTIEQLAGDLLPNPTLSQLIATGFHRNSLTNAEGGANHEEYRNAAVIDRVNTTWETWQATTMGCVQCHNHPYDPIRQTDFYSSFAIFNNTNDRNLRQDYPLLKTFEDTDEQQLQQLKAWISQHSSEQQAGKWERLIRTHEPKILAPDFHKTVNTKFYNRTGDDFMVVYDSSQIHIKGVDLEGMDQLYFHYQNRGVEGNIRIQLNGSNGPIIGNARLKKTKGLEMLPISIQTQSKKRDLWISFESKKEGFQTFLEGFMLIPNMPGAGEKGYADIQQVFADLIQAPATITTPIFVEKPEAFRRTTHVFERGNWLVQGEEVAPGIPSVFSKAKQPPNIENRLDLAKWLVSKENPLTARVMVNRIWARLFGRGIVSTLEDFGTMGEEPTHPELLDWMAKKFAEEQSWSLKQLIRSIVLSSTYRQSSQVSQEALEKDPDNVWLARSPRTRLSAEQVRDQALKVSGLFSKKMYGPGVMPPQPDGIWKVSFSNAKWVVSEGEDRYRRAVYTYLKRTALYPSFLTFDAAGREVCLSRRITTNTPLQALVTLNDPVYFEAAKALANRMLEVEGKPGERLEKGYQLVLGKQPSKEKLAVLQNLYRETSQYYQTHPEEARSMVQSDDLELAVFTIVANSLMNMDEFIVRR